MLSSKVWLPRTMCHITGWGLSPTLSLFPSVWEREERMERKAHLPVCSSVSSDWQVDMQFCSWKEDRQGLGMWPTIMFEKNKGLDGVAGDRHVKTSCCSASSIQRESSLEMTQQWSRCIFFDIDLRLKRQRIFCGAVFPFSPSPSLAFTGMTETNIADVSVLLQNYPKIQYMKLAGNTGWRMASPDGRIPVSPWFLCRTLKRKHFGISLLLLKITLIVIFFLLAKSA